MTVDRIKTKKYYETLTQTSLCDCAYCRLYYEKARKAFPQLAKWLDGYGIDIEKPWEAMSLDPDEDGIVDYIGVQYIVFGSCAADDVYKIGDISIRVSGSYPDPAIDDDFFVLEAYPMSLPTEESFPTKPCL